MPSGPKIFERYIVNINPRIPVVTLDAVSKKEFFKKLSFPNLITP